MINCSVIPSGDSCEIAVRFKPIALGHQRATLEIHSNDPDENPITLILSGNGIKKRGPLVKKGVDSVNPRRGTEK
jgi:hypothetical protein